MVDVVFFSESPNSACHKYRVVLPVMALQNNHGIRARYSAKWDTSTRGADVLVFQRNSTHAATSLILSLVDENRTFVYDVDDDLFQIPRTNPVFGLYYNMDEGQRDVAILGRQVVGMRFASVVTASSERLCEVYSVVNPNVRLLPNFVDMEEWKNVDALLAPKPGIVRLFWGGSPTHFQDLQILTDALRDLGRELGDKFELVVMGDDSVKFSCPTVRIPFGTYQFFQGIMKSCDIGLAPMADDLFNRAKSDLRIKEMSCAGMAVVASPVGEYAKSFAFLCKTTEDWIKALANLIQSRGTRSEAGSAAYNWVVEQDIRKHIGLWESLFEELYGYNRRGIGKVIKVQSAELSPDVLSGGKVRVG